MEQVQEIRQVSATEQSEAGTLDAPKPRKKLPIARIILGVIVVCGAVFGVREYREGQLYEDTDDAQVDGDISAISPRINGTIKSVAVVENQAVKAGDLLAEIDPADYEVALLEAKAQVAQAEAQLKAEDPTVAATETTNKVLVATTGSDIANAGADISGAQASLQQSIAQQTQAESNLKLAQTEYDRTKHLVDTGAATSADLDTKTAALDSAKAALDAAQQGTKAARDRITQAQARYSANVSKHGEAEQNAPRILEQRKANVELRKAAVDLAKAELAQAELNVRYTKILAPVTGVIGKKSVNVGDRVQPGQELFAITQTEHLWVTANFRETQLRSMHPGQHVELYVDAIDKTLSGSIESVSGATGSKYSLLPPENATGNYVKVVQRIPVRIRIDGDKADLDRLRPGMSVEPKVRVK